MRKATRAAAKHVLELARQFVPVDEGDLEASLTVRAMKGRRRRGTVGASVLTREGMFRGDEFYGGFVEFGTRERFHRSGKSTGAVPAGTFDYLRRALYEGEQKAKQEFITSLREFVAEAKK